MNSTRDEYKAEKKEEIDICDSRLQLKEMIQKLWEATVEKP